ncbi:hypothetical protein POSPLADRAFT_1035912 [Postia placenta MAD-698-R-SB12]|uniref:Major facilitator superfamily (MFS) profile domain-containing protein n=1 Tax=Postia placenta MAD-698-R-SB12 TaxID=670580 RepID=A0A1X6MR01_9APHY|nr:hypothetical protein POSPLADRAFT_1035912 [Postia placenta MAD-698-R-SB12]OSX58815.1 hypothetical protein POSPLADRAFT_1035912 [Postia placenta MAD-698-R-SB12]
MSDASSATSPAPKHEPDFESEKETKTPPQVEEAPPPPTQQLDAPPDGGAEAWMTVAGTWFLAFITFGVATVWGVFQDAYVSNSTSRFQNISVFRLGFVGGCATGFAFLAGPFSNILVSNFGVHKTVLVGVIMVAISFELASIAKEYWELFLSQGLMFGLGASLAFIPSAGLPSQWFAKRRNLATAIASSGSGISAVILSSVCQAIIDASSIAWALRFLGFLTLVFGLAGVSLIRVRTVAKKQVQYKVLDLSILKVRGYPLYLAYAFLQFFGYCTPVFFIPSYCTAIGLSPTKASGVLSIATGLNAVGRVMAGVFGDIIGPINVLIMFNSLTGLMCILVWYFAKTFGDMVGFAILWGFFCGAYWALSVPVSAKIVGLPRLGSAVALQFLMNVIPPVFAVPIGSRIINATAASHHVAEESRTAYKYLIVFTFLVPVIASFMLIPVRLGFSKKLMVKV